MSAIIVYRAIASSWRETLNLEPKHKLMVAIIVILSLHNIFIPTLVSTAKLQTETYDGPTLSVMTLNKRYENQEFMQIINYVRLQDPDILAVQEAYEEDANLLANKLGFGYWHVAECDCSSYGSDLALFSRFPIENTAMVYEDRIGGVLRGEVVLGHESRLVVYITHIVPAYSAKAYNIRHEMLSNLEDYVKSETDPVLLMGDFSATPFSVDVRNFTVGVEKSMLGTQQTPWPKCSWFKYSQLFCTRIDYVFIPSAGTLLSQTIGPDVGSDHRPLSVVFGLDY